MPIYNLNNQRYNIPDDVVDDFERDNPDATIAYNANGNIYDIPVNKKQGFLQRFPDAVLHDDIPQVSGQRVDNTISGGVGTQEEADSLFELNRMRLNETDPNKRAALEMQYNQLENRARERDNQELRERIESNGEIDRLQEIKGRAQLEIDKSSFFDRFFNADTRAAVAARDEAEEALEMYSEANRQKDGWFEKNVEGVLRGFFDKFGDLRTWDFGASGVSSAVALKDASEKLERGESLTPAEQNMLDAYGLSSAVQAAYQDKVGTAYRVGGSLPESLAFGASLAFNPVGGAGRKIAETAAKAAVKKYGTGLVSKLAKGAARVGGDIVEMGVATAVPGAGRVAEDYYNRLNGQSTFDIDKNGIIRYGGQVEQEEADDAIWKAFGSQFIENYSEAMGNYFAPMGTMLSNLTSKGLKAAHLGKLSEAITDISSSQWSKGLQRFKDAVKFDGLVGEYLEEVAGNFMNAATVGDMNFNSPEDPRSVFNPDTNIETFLSCALLSGTMYAVEAPVTLYNKHTAKKNLRNADKAASEMLGGRWEDLRNQMDSASPEHLAQILTGVQNAADLSEEQKAAAKNYGLKLAQYQGYNARMVQNAQESTAETNEANNAYNEGSENDSPQYVFVANRERTRAAEALKAVDENVASVIDTAFETGESVEPFINSLDENVAPLARDYYNKSMRLRGVIDGVMDRAEDVIAEEERIIRSVTDPSTGLYTEISRLVTDERGERVPQPGYVVGWIGEGENRMPTFLPEGAENIPENRVSLKPAEFDASSIQYLPMEDVISLNAEMIRERAQKDLKDKSSMSEQVYNYVPANGDQVTDENGQVLTITNISPDGVEYLNGEGRIEQMPLDDWKGLMQAQLDANEAAQAESIKVEESNQAIVDNLQSKPMDDGTGRVMQPKEVQGDKVVYDIADANGTVLEEGSMNAAQYNEVNTPEAIGENVSSVEVAQQPQVEAQQSPVIPTKEDGSIDFVTYGKEGSFKTLGERYGEKMPNKVAVTAKAFAEDVAKARIKLDKAQKAYDNAPIGREDKAKNALDQAQQELDAIKREAEFWAEMDAEIKSAQLRRSEILNPQAEIEASNEPMTADEFVAQQLAAGNIVLNKDDYMRETGFGSEEANEMNGGAKKLFGKDGMTIQEAGERLMEMDRENGTNFFDQSDSNAGRDALISVLGSVKSRKELNQYISENRKAQAERDSEGLRNELEKQVMEANYSSLEDYVLQMEAAEVDIPFEGMDIATKDAIFAEAEEEYQSYLKSLENGQGTTSEVAEGNDNVLSEEQSDDTGGTEERQGQVDGTGQRTLQEGESAHVGEQADEVELTRQEGETIVQFAERVAEENRRRPLRKRANEWSKALGVKVTLLESIDDVDARTRVQIEEAHAEGSSVPGWVAPNGEVFFFMPDLHNMDDVDNTYIHEVVAHIGLPKLLGEERFNEVCDKVWEMMPQSQKDFYEKNYPGVKGIKNETLRHRRAADEYIAHLAEKENLTPEEKTIWDNIVKAFRELLDKALNGIIGKSKITDEDISNLIKASYANLKSGAEGNVSGEGTRFSAKRTSDRRQEMNHVNNTVDQALSLVYGKDIKEIRKERHEEEQKRKEDAAEIYQSVLSGDFNDVTLQKINDYIDDATPLHPYGKRISQRLPQKLERGLHEGARTNAVDALFSRICESAVPAYRRASETGRREVEERKKEALKGWAIATNNWHTDLSDFADEADFIRQGTDSKVYLAKDGKHVIKVSFGKPEGKRFRPDIDTTALFNNVFRNTAYEIVGYGEFDGKFARILKQPFVDFADKTALNAEEREEYMRTLGFEPINESKTAFSNGSIVAADLQKSNILKDAAGNISVIDADMKLHTKDVGGNYTYPPVEADLPEGTRFRIAYHGSAADFDKFSKDFIGSGEGNSVAGYGFYVTSDDSVGKYYADFSSKSKRKVVQAEGYTVNGELVKDSALVSAYKLLKENEFDVEKSISYVEERIEQKKKEPKKGIFGNSNLYENMLVYLQKEQDNPGTLGYQEEVIEQPGRYLYEVEIPDDNGKNYLDLDKSVPKNVKEKAKEKVFEYLYNGEDAEYWKNNKSIIEEQWKLVEKKGTTADTLRGTMQEIVGREEVSDIFSDMGYIGFKTSEDSERGTTYVVFDESNLNVVNHTRFRVTKESQAIIDKAKADGNYMKAPNGKPTNLNEKQWVQVRTKAFKKWFGDWEKKPKKSSLMVDENGEPKVFYHGSPNEFNEFLSDKMGMTGTSYGQGFYFSPDKDFADYYKRETGSLYELFINMRKSLSDTKKTIRRNDIRRLIDDIDKRMKGRDDEGIGILENWDDVEIYGRTRVLNEAVEAVDDYNDTDVEIVGDLINTSGSYDTVVESLRETLGYDGIIPSNTDNEIIVHHSNQVKSAISNEGTFDSENNDIRFRFIGERGARNLDKSEEATTRLDNLSVAREMESAEKDAKTIKMATGWERGADGKWRYEVDDNINFDTLGERSSKLKKAYSDAQEKYYRFESRVPSRTPRNATEEEKQRIKDLRKELTKLRKEMRKAGDAYYDSPMYDTTLGDFIGENNNLFKEYPDLKDVGISFVRNARYINQGFRGFYDPESNSIWIDDWRPKGDIKSSLVHEIQHAIQHIEGFSWGGSAAFFEQAKEEAQNRKYEFNELINKFGFEDWEKNIPIEELMEYGKKYKGEFGLLHLAFIENVIEDKYVQADLRDELESVKAAYSRFYEKAGGERHSYKTPRDWYLSLGGEVEARNVQQRMGMTDEQRRNTLASETEDVAREDQIFLNGALEEGTRFRRVYHGSGASFDRFDHGFMGTGEGSQAYGWGTYVSEVEGIARTYAGLKANNSPVASHTLRWLDENSTYEDFISKGEGARRKKTIEDAKEFLENLKEDGASEDIIDAYEQDLNDAERAITEDGYNQTKENMIASLNRHLYEVEIPDDNGLNYLSWNDEVQKEKQKELVNAIYDEILYIDLDGAYDEEIERLELKNDLWRATGRGGDLYGWAKSLGGDRAASEFFSEHGYVGIKVPTNNLRDGDKSHWNYVIFNENDLQIVNHTRFRISDKGRKIQNEVDKFTTKYNSKEVVLVDSEMTDNELEEAIPFSSAKRTREEITKGYMGGYSTYSDKIYIFVDNHSVDGMEDSMFHENLHPLFNDSEIVESFYDRAKDMETEVMEIVKVQYKESEYPNELFANIVAWDLNHGNFKHIEAYLTEEQQNELFDTLKEFGYDKGEESERRGRNGSSSEESDTSTGKEQEASEPMDGGLHERERSQGEQAERLRVLFGQVADMGLDGVLGNKAYTSAMVDIYKALPDDVRAIVAEDALRHYGGSVAPAVSDYLNHKEANVWDKVVGIIKDALRKVGFDVDLNANDVKYILWRSQKSLDRNNLLDMAEDIDMRYRLKVGEYSSNDGGDTPGGGGTRFRVTNKLNIRDKYEATIKKGSYQAREAVQDAMLSLRRVQELIEKETGKKLRDFENAWMHENRLSSVVQSAIHEMERKFYKPMMDAVKKLMDSAILEQNEVADYLMLKHGIERNREMAVRKALTDSEGKIDKVKLEQWYQDKQAIRNDATLDTWRKKQEAMDNAALNYGADMSRDYSGLTSMFDTDDLADCTGKAYNEVEALENAHPAETEALGKAIKAMTQNTLDESFGSGLMNKAVYEELSNDMYDYYIPLRGFEETTSDEVYAYMDNDRGAFNAPLVRAKGRSSKSDNPLAYLKSIAESGIMQGERNKMKQTFLNMVINHPSDLVSVREGVWAIFNPATGEWEAASFPERLVPRNASPADVDAAYQQWEEDMELRAKTDPNVKKISEAADVPYRVIGNRINQHQVIVKRLGKSYTLTINGNPRLAMALNGQTNPNNTSNDGKVSAFVQQKIDALNRTLSAWYTTRNPDFVASNFMRDTFYTNTIVRAKEGNGYANQFHKYYAKLLKPGKMISLFYKYENGTLDASKPVEKDFLDFMMNGGETGYSNLKDLEHIKKQISKELKGDRFAMFTKAAEKLDLLNRAVENTARFAAFRTSRRMGRTIAKSVFDAKEISVNFNKKGSGGTFFGATGQTTFGNLAAMVGAGGRAFYVFFNAAIQGTTNLMHVMKVNPMGTGAGIGAMFLMGAVIPYLFAGDDDDEKDYYDIPEHVRRNHLIIPGTGDAWVSIPLPIEYRIMYGMGELLTSWRTGHERGENIGRKMLSLTGQALPINFLEEGFDAFMPSALSPIWQIYNNESWTGLPIYKDTDFNKQDPEYTKAYKNVDRLLYNFSKAMYEWAFDEENQKARIDLNPAMMETLARGYFGGLATQLSNLGKTYEMIAGEREFDWRSIPVANRIFKSGDERTKEKRITNEYFENIEKLEFLQSRKRLLKKTKDGSAVPEEDKLRAEEDFKIMEGTDVYKKYMEFNDKKKKVDKVYRKRKEKDSKELETKYYNLMEEANRAVRQ